MKRSLIPVLGVALVVLGVTARAQTSLNDPLAPAYLPVVDTNPADYPSQIWMTDSLAKVLQTGGAPGPNHWITVYSMKNEIQSFQVHVQAGSAPIGALTATMSDLVNAQTGFHISAASTDIVVYREAYENVTTSTATGLTFLNATGNIPDILIPAVDPYYHQTTKAFPFTVAAGNNQSIWVDVHTPSTAPSGYYSGTITVNSGQNVLTTMPVTFAIWDWQMPSTASLPSTTAVSYGGFCLQVYGAAGCATYPGALGNPDLGVTLANVDAAVQMLDNRYSLSGMTNIYPGSGSFAPTNGSASFDAVYGPLLSGTPAHVAGILPGAKLTTWPIAVLQNQLNTATFQNFQSHFAAKGWVAPFYPLMDEPNPSDPAVWTTLIAAGNLEHTFTSPDIPTEVTTDIVTAGKYGALSAIDMMVVLEPVLEPGGGAPMQNLTTYQNWLAGSPSRSFWSYQSCSNSGTCSNGITGPQYPANPNTFPNYDIDGTPVANRVGEWLTYLHGQTGELYYYIDICDGPGGVSTQCGYPAAGNAYNPLVSNYYAGGWGDGTLMYPGSTAYAGTPIPIWLPSMRLKYIRDGMQDYEYLHALNGLAYGSTATMQLQSFISNSYTFDNDPAGLQAARTALGTQLHQIAINGPGYKPGPAPVITNVVPSSITTSSVAINWSTNTASTSQVVFGLTSSYGQYSAINAALVTSHSVTLSSLSTATVYHFRVQSRDSSGNLVTSGDYTVTTATIPPVISAVQASSITASSAVLTWLTTTNSSSQVDYGLTSSYGQSSALAPALVTNHSVFVSLSAATVYHYRVKSTDSVGNLVVSGDYVLTTQAAPSPSGAPGGIALVQHAGGHGLVVAFAAAVKSGDLITVSFSGDQGNYPISLITDTGGNTYTRAVSCLAAAGMNGEIWYANVAQGGADTVHIQAAGGGNVGIAEFSGAATTNPLDVANCNATPIAPTYSTGSVTTATANELLYAAVLDGGGIPTVGSGFTLLDVGIFNWEFGDEYAFAPSPAGYAASFGNMGTRNDGAIMVAAFKAAGSPVGPGSITMVQHAVGHGRTLGFTGKVTQGNLIAVSFSGDQGNYPISSISDTQGNAFVRAVYCLSAAGVNGEIWYAAGVAVGSDTLTIRAAGGGDVGIVEFSGISSSTPLDASGCNNAPVGPTYSTGMLTTAYPNEMIYSAVVDGGGVPTGGVGYTLLNTQVFNWEFGDEFGNTTAPGGYSASFGNLGNRNDGAIMLAAFRPASGSSPSSTSPPVISNIASSNVTSSSAVIGWTTTSLSDSQVNYGTTSSYGQSSVLNATPVVTHTGTLGSLFPATIYHYQVQSRDAYGNLTVSGDNTFTTLGALRGPGQHRIDPAHFWSRPVALVPGSGNGRLNR